MDAINATKTFCTAAGNAAMTGGYYIGATTAYTGTVILGVAGLAAGRDFYVEAKVSLEDGDRHALIMNIAKCAICVIGGGTAIYLGITGMYSMTQPAPSRIVDPYLHCYIRNNKKKICRISSFGNTSPKSSFSKI